MTNVEQLIPNAKGKDYHREVHVRLEYMSIMMHFQSLSPSFIYDILSATKCSV